jgi:hypothetical protein
VLDDTPDRERDLLLEFIFLPFQPYPVQKKSVWSFAHYKPFGSLIQF